MPDVRPARFSHTSRAHARLYNLAISRRPALRLGGAGESITLGPGLLMDVPDAAPMTLTSASGQAWLTLEPALLKQWLQPWIGNEALTSLPPVLRSAAYHAALDPLFMALETATGIAFAPAESPAPLPSASTRLGLWLSDPGLGNPSALLDVDDAIAAALAVRLERLPPIVGEPERWSSLPVEVTLWLGQSRLTVEEFRGLASGDILLLPPSMPANAALELLLRQAGQPLAVARLQCRQLLIDRLVSAAMSESSPTPDTTPAALDPDALPIRIDFDLGSLTLPLRELRAIQPGYSFELDRPEPQAVRLMVGSQVIGHGELVQIDDRLGVRVTALFPAPE